MDYGIWFHAMESSVCVNNSTFQKRFSTLLLTPGWKVFTMPGGIMEGEKEGGKA